MVEHIYIFDNYSRDRNIDFAIQPKKTLLQMFLLKKARFIIFITLCLFVL